MSSNHSNKHALAMGLATVVAMIASQAAHCQTIGEYSAAQRAALMADLEKSRKVVPGGSPDAASAPARAPAVAPAPVRVQKPVPMERRVTVNGVFIARNKPTIEVAVDGRPHFLEVGQLVPGTPWRVDRADASAVVLSRDSAAGMQGRSVSKASRVGGHALGQAGGAKVAGSAKSGSQRDQLEPPKARELKTFYLQGIRQRAGA